MVRTVVGLFTSVSAAQQAVEQLLGAGFAQDGIHLATPDSLAAQHLPATEPGASPGAFEAGIGHFFSNLFAGNEPEDAGAYAAATRPEHAVLMVDPATPEAADRARAIFAAHHAVDVYQQPQPVPTTPAEADDIDLPDGLRHVRGDDELDANGLTTH